MNAYARIEKYKAALTGFAILTVLYGHYFYYHSGLQSYQNLNVTLWYAIGFVDFFMFLSGFGIYHSLSNNEDPLRFMRRRLGRLLPSYLPLILAFCVYSLWTGIMTPFQALGNLTILGWLAQIGGQFNWYFPTLIVMYLLSPLFYRIIKCYGRKSLLMIPLLFLIEGGGVGTSLMIGLSRFPIYFLGMYLAMEAQAGRKPSKRHLILSGVMAVLSLIALYFLVILKPNWLSKYGFWWHPYFFSTPGCLYFASWIHEKFDKWKPTRLLNRIFTWLGGKSFELYLVHLFVYMVALNIGITGYIPWIGVALLALILGILYSILVNTILSKRKSK